MFRRVVVSGVVVTLVVGLASSAAAATSQGLSASCADKHGDAKTIHGSQIDLTSARVSSSPVATGTSLNGLPKSVGPGLRFSWTMADYLDSNAKALFRVTMRGSGRTRYVVEWDDTKKYGSTLVSDAAGQHLRNAVESGGGLDMQQVEVDVPLKMFSKLRGSVTWDADASVRGKMSDTCARGPAFTAPKR
jgi:hypothetical protein